MRARVSEGKPGGMNECACWRRQRRAHTLTQRLEARSKSERGALHKECCEWNVGDSIEVKCSCRPF